MFTSLGGNDDTHFLTNSHNVIQQSYDIDISFEYYTVVVSHTISSVMLSYFFNFIELAADIKHIETDLILYYITRNHNVPACDYEALISIVNKTKTTLEKNLIELQNQTLTPNSIRTLDKDYTILKDELENAKIIYSKSIATNWQQKQETNITIDDIENLDIPYTDFEADNFNQNY